MLLNSVKLCRLLFVLFFPDFRCHREDMHLDCHKRTGLQLSLLHLIIEVGVKHPLPNVSLPPGLFDGSALLIEGLILFVKDVKVFINFLCYLQVKLSEGIVCNPDSIIDHLICWLGITYVAFVTLYLYPTVWNKIGKHLLAYKVLPVFKRRTLSFSGLLFWHFFCFCWLFVFYYFHD